MTTLESYKKFGLETRGAVGIVLAAGGCAVLLLGLGVIIAEGTTGAFGLEGAAPVMILLFFFVFGAALLLSGIRRFLKDKERVDGLKEAYENGRFVMADIAGVRPGISETTGDNMFTGVSYRRAYTVECRYTDPAGETRVFYSRTFWRDPTDMIVARQVPVYIDRNNEKNCFVDIDRAMGAKG